jgi:hypothetical protein
MRAYVGHGERKRQTLTFLRLHVRQAMSTDVFCCLVGVTAFLDSMLPYCGGVKVLACSRILFRGDWTVLETLGTPQLGAAHK